MYSVDLRTAERGIDPVATYETVATGVCPLSTSIVVGGTTVAAKGTVGSGAIVGAANAVRGGSGVDGGGTVVSLGRVRGGSLSSSEALGGSGSVDASPPEKGNDGATTAELLNSLDPWRAFVPSNLLLPTKRADGEN
jgi:hypothetical protein